MKKQFTIFAIIIFLFTSCENFLGLKNQSKTTLTISLPKSRAVYAKGEVSKYSVTVKYLGDEEPLFGDITKTVEAGESVLFEEVQAGLNLVQILAYNSIDKVIAKGETEVDVIEEQENAATVLMHLFTYFNVYFDSNNGSESVISVVCDENEVYVLPEECDFDVPEGKKFAGWSFSKDGETVDFTSIEVKEDITFYAIWVDEYKGGNPPAEDPPAEDPPAEDPPVVTPKIYISENASGSGDGSKENPFTVQQGLSDVKDGTEVYVLSDLHLDSAMIIASVKIIGSKEGTGEPISVKYGGDTTRILSLASTIVLENIIFDGEDKEKGTAPVFVMGNVTFNKCEFRNFNINGGTSASSKGILYVAGNKKAVLNDCVFENFPSTVSAISIDANGYCELNNSAIIPQEGASAINVESGGQYKIDGVEGTESKSGEILVDYISLIENAEAGDVIKLLHDFSVEDGFLITNDLTIDGNGKTITRVSSEGEVNGPLFYVMYKQTLKISELTIDCNNIKVVDVSIAGIQNEGTMILVDCRIENILSENIGIMNKANSSYTIKNVIVGNDEIGDESDTSISEDKSF